MIFDKKKKNNNSPVSIDIKRNYVWDISFRYLLNFDFAQIADGFYHVATPH